MATGYQANVVANTPILSSWGNLIRDRTVMVFASAAERDAAIPAPQVGMTCYVVGAGTPFQQYNGAGVGWTAPWSSAWGEAYGNAIEVVGGAQMGPINIGTGEVPVNGLAFPSITVPLNRRCRIRAKVPAQSAGAANCATQLRIYADAVLVASEFTPFGAIAEVKSLQVEKHFVGSNTPRVYQAKIIVTSGGGTNISTVWSATVGAYLSLEDLGPHAAPA